MLPSVTVEYKDMRVEADALVGSAGIPSLFNVALAFLKVPLPALLLSRASIKSRNVHG